MKWLPGREKSTKQKIDRVSVRVAVGQRPRITVLNHDLSGNSFGRAYILARMLSEYYDVKIVGPAKKGIVWGPYEDCGIQIIKVPYRKWPRLLLSIPDILKKIDGDVIYAVKPKFTSFGFALIKKMTSNTPVILDIDDWEMGFLVKNDIRSKLSRLFNLRVTLPDGFFWTWLMNYFVDFANKKTTISTFLQGKYGGEIIPHAKDTDFLDPNRVQGDDLREKLHLEGKKVLMFLGTLRKHKGIEDVLSALSMIDDPDLLLIIIGGDRDGNYENGLKRMGGNRVLIMDQIPFRDLPRYLSLADIIVVPQRQTPETAGQIPSKLLDAMSMGKPIISTRVSDIPYILEGCGIIVEPGSPHAMKEAIVWFLSNPEKAVVMGQEARVRCIKHYSFLSVKGRLKEIVDDVLKCKK